MKKILLKIGMLSLSAVMFTACGGGGGGGDNPPPANVAPVAKAGADMTVDEADTVTFASESTDSDGSISTYSWTENGSVLSTAKSLTKSNFSIGSHTITLTVTDNRGAKDSDALQVTVNNVVPVADAGQNIVLNEGTAAPLDASKSSDKGGVIASYVWAENGQTIGDAKHLNYAFSVGYHDVTLTVTDPQGLSASDSVIVEIKNIAPSANAGADINAARSEDVTFDASLSSDAGGIKTHEWKEDGKVISSKKVFTKQYNAAGTFNVTLTVTDNQGETAIDTMIITIINKVPKADAGSDILVNEGTEVNFDGSGSADTDGTIVKYEWKEGDTLLGTGVTLSKMLAVGEHTITLIVTDSDGATAEDIVLVDVNEIPTAIIEGNSTNVWERDLVLDGSRSSDPDGTIVSYNWSPSNTGAIATFTPATLGMHTYSLSVTDNDGATSPEVSKNVETILCEGQTAIDLLNEVDGTLNILPNNNSASCYKIDLASNNGAATYTFYMNLLAGTVTHGSYITYVEIFDKNGQSVHKFDTDAGKMYAVRSFRETFEISNDETYYIKVSRGGGQHTEYAFSIHPSIDNGLVQNIDKELNDEFSMAAPLTLTDAMADIKGNLNNARRDENSLKNTDSDDYYSIKIDNAGTYTFYMNLLSGTVTQSSYVTTVEIFDENHISVHKFDTVAGKMYAVRSFRETFDIAQSGNYYMRIYRGGGQGVNYAFSIHPSIDNGLVQNIDKELNDEFSMAAPLTLVDVSSEISGTLNTTRTVNNSLKNTDNQDIYYIEFTQAGDYIIDMNLYAGTVTHGSYAVKVKMYDENEQLIHTFSTSHMYAKGTNLNEPFTIPSASKYYLKIQRDAGQAVNYGFTIQ